MATADPTPTTPTTWKQKAFDWALQQGLASVLILIGVVGIWKSAPYMLDRLDKIMEHQDASLKAARDDYRAELNVERAANRANEEANRQTFSRSIDELTREIRRPFSLLPNPPTIPTPEP